MELVCAAGFWMVMLASGQRFYTDDPRTAPAPAQAVVCRSWESLPKVVPVRQPVPRPYPRLQHAIGPAVPFAGALRIPLLGQSTQGYPTCAQAREARRSDTVPCSPWTPER